MTPSPNVTVRKKPPLGNWYEWREATLRPMDGLSDEEAERIERLVRDKRLLARVQTALRQVVAKAPHRFQKTSQA